MAPVGQPLAHSPQAVHLSQSMRARKLSTVMAPCGQVFSHLWQPMQPEEQTLRVYGPL